MRPVAFALLALMSCGRTHAQTSAEALLSAHAVVVGHFERGRYAEYSPDTYKGLCYYSLEPDGTYICHPSAPPAMVLTLVVDDVLQGQLKPRTFEVFATSHWGLRSFSFGTRYRHLVRIIERNGKLWIPGYQHAQLARTKDGNWAIPVWDPEPPVDWLPCDLQTPLETMRFSGPKPWITQARDDWDDDELDRSRSYVVVNGGKVEVVRGLKLERAREYLSTHELGSEDWRCDGEDAASEQPAPAEYDQIAEVLEVLEVLGSKTVSASRRSAGAR
jgi:hypothetical protein